MEINLLKYTEKPETMVAVAAKLCYSPVGVRELLHFFTVRCCNRAQWEIREMAINMLKQVKKVAPIVFEKAGPNCLRGPCPEGKFKCGDLPKASDFKV